MQECDDFFSVCLHLITKESYVDLRFEFVALIVKHFVSRQKN